MMDAVDWYRGEIFFARRRKIFEISFQLLGREGLLSRVRIKEVAKNTDQRLKKLRKIPKSAMLVAVSMPITRDTLLLSYQDNSFDAVAEGCDAPITQITLAEVRT